MLKVNLQHEEHPLWNFLKQYALEKSRIKKRTIQKSHNSTTPLFTCSHIHCKKCTLWPDCSVCKHVSRLLLQNSLWPGEAIIEMRESENGDIADRDVVESSESDGDGAEVSLKDDQTCVILNMFSTSQLKSLLNKRFKKYISFHLLLSRARRETVARVTSFCCSWINSL